MFSILIILLASVVGRHTTFKGIYLKNPREAALQGTVRFLGMFTCVCVCRSGGDGRGVIVAFLLTVTLGGQSSLTRAGLGLLACPLILRFIEHTDFGL